MEYTSEKLEEMREKEYFDRLQAEMEQEEVRELTREDFEEEKEVEEDLIMSWMEAAEEMELNEEETEQLREFAWEWERWELEGEECAEFFQKKWWTFMCYPVEDGVAVRRIYEPVERPSPEL